MNKNTQDCLKIRDHFYTDEINESKYMIRAIEKDLLKELEQKERLEKEYLSSTECFKYFCEEVSLSLEKIKRDRYNTKFMIDDVVFSFYNEHALHIRTVCHLANQYIAYGKETFVEEIRYLLHAFQVDFVYFSLLKNIIAASGYTKLVIPQEMTIKDGKKIMSVQVLPRTLDSYLQLAFYQEEPKLKKLPTFEAKELEDCCNYYYSYRYLTKDNHYILPTSNFISATPYIEMEGIDVSTIASYHSVITSRANSLVIET